MPNYRRRWVPGGTYFFTVNLAQRGDDLLTRRIADLRGAYGAVQAQMPFRTRGIVILPDHIHAVWTLPEGDVAFPERWRRIKSLFSQSVAETRPRTYSKARKGEVGIWQRRYWENVVEDDTRLSTALWYIRENPVRHGYVDRPEDWPFSRSEAP
ncbi:REP-associated tyrosine transposase [Palleronia abyssalis]|uniref:REP-associated tyrosine transposase n=1 Tax=Palleronia abyssalis TaxID=1501240 RepID=A0A2R8BTZ7_9RHOB|nr:transposase [Palleronia abyssalis]SPJ23649.1 REP-associated tyrosine transposase [Palleronia abyssalis]